MGSIRQGITNALCQRHTKDQDEKNSSAAHREKNSHISPELSSGAKDIPAKLKSSTKFPISFPRISCATAASVCPATVPTVTLDDSTHVEKYLPSLQENVFNNSSYSTKCSSYAISYLQDGTKMTTARITDSENPLQSIFELKSVISKRKCKDIIDLSEAFAVRYGGWTTDRHKYFPTVDLPTKSIPGVSSIVDSLCKTHVIPSVKRLYKLDTAAILKPCDLFVVKYEVNPRDQKARQALDYHRDGSIISFILLLSDPCEFTGGGTHIESINHTLKPDQGNCILMCGKLRHSGAAIYSGKRYILIGFLDVVSPEIEQIGKDEKKALTTDLVWLNSLWKPLRKYMVGDVIIIASDRTGEKDYEARITKIEFGTQYVRVRRMETSYPYPRYVEVIRVSLSKVKGTLSHHRGPVLHY